MHASSLALAERWEDSFGDPESPQAPLNFQSALELDESEVFPRTQLDALTALNVFETLIPQAEGGALHEPEQLVMLGRLLARRDPTVAIAFGQTMLGSLPVWLAGSADQKRCLSADLRAGRLGCLALTEKEHGSDILSCEVSAQATDGGFVFNGAKWLINNGRMGGSATVLGKLQRPGRGPELALWWLRKTDTAMGGWHAHPKIQTHGIRGADISGFTLEGHVAGADALLQGDDPALYTVLKTLQISRILCSGFSLGAVDTMFRLTLRFARERMLYGRRVIDIPVVRTRLSRSMARLVGADVIAQVSSRAIAALPAQLSLWSAIAKYQVPTEAEGIVRDLAVVLGARHYVRNEWPWGLFQKFMRDNQVVSLFDGSTQVNLSLIAAQLRALSEGLASPSAVPPELVDRLLDPAAGCAGWPTQAEMQLANQGQDAIAQTFLHTRDWPAFDGLLLEAVQRLQHDWRRWIEEAVKVTWVQRLPHDSVRTMGLAQRYVDLHAAAALVLACHRQAAAGSSGLCGPATLWVWLSAKGWIQEYDVPDQIHEEVLDQALACVDRRELLSLQRLSLA